MANGIRKGDPCGFNKGRNSNFRECFLVQQTSEEGWRTYRPKRCGNNKNQYLTGGIHKSRCVCLGSHKDKEWHIAFFDMGVQSRAEAQLRERIPKCHGPCRQSPKKGFIRRQAINLALQKQGRPLRDGLLRTKECRSKPRDTNARLPRYAFLAVLTDVTKTSNQATRTVPCNENYG